MTEDIAANFIDLTAKLYDLSEKAVLAMQGNSAEINEAFSDYYWSDVRKAVNYYFARKNDKTRPTIAKILAILESDRDVHKRAPDPESVPATKYARPTTGLWSITVSFDRLVDVLMAAGVIPDEHGTLRNDRSIVDPATGTLVVAPRQWFAWRLLDAERSNPDLFAKFPRASFLERLAIAVQNHLIHFLVRDWGKYSKAHPEELLSQRVPVTPCVQSVAGVL